jgi:hypothetical protein
MHIGLVSFLTSALPHTLSLLDRDMLSHTAGCFDKNYWHYKKTSHANAMMQNYTLSLSLYYAQRVHLSELIKETLGSPKAIQFGSIWKEQSGILPQFIQSSIKYALSIAHRDGSYDEHYRFEKPVVATAFVLLSLLKSVKSMADSPHPMFLGENAKNAIKKSIVWLLKNHEAVDIGNHQAGACLAMLLGMELLCDISTFEGFATELTNLLAKQSPEGWFPEYSGCDTGYLSLTLAFLTQLYEALSQAAKADLFKVRAESCKNFAEQVKAAILRILHFYEQVHLLGYPTVGYLWSRKTNHFFISGFCKAVRLFGKDPEFPAEFIHNLLADFLALFESGAVEQMSDDAFLFFQLNDLLESVADLAQLKPQTSSNDNRFPNNTMKFLPDAGLLIITTPAQYTYLSLKATNAIASFSRITPEGKINVYTGPALQLHNQKLYHSLVLSTPQLDLGLPLRRPASERPPRLTLPISATTITISGCLQPIPDSPITPFQSLGLTFLGMTLLKWGPFNRLVKRILIRRLISHASTSPYFLQRTITIEDSGVITINEGISAVEKDAQKINQVYLTHGINAFYVPSGEFFNPQQYQPPEIVTNQIKWKPSENNQKKFEIAKSV